MDKRERQKNEARSSYQHGAAASHTHSAAFLAAMAPVCMGRPAAVSAAAGRVQQGVRRAAPLAAPARRSVAQPAVVAPRPASLSLTFRAALTGARQPALSGPGTGGPASGPHVWLPQGGAAVAAASTRAAGMYRHGLCAAVARRAVG